MKTLGLLLAFALAPLTLCATNGFADTLTIVSGNNQIVKRGGSDIPGGKANFGPLSVVFKDAAGKPVAGKRVNFLCQTPNQGMACQLEPAGGASAALTTDANGVANLNQMGGNSITVYYASGKFTVQAAADGVPALSFALEAQDAPAPPAPIATAVMAVVSGDNQTAARMPTASAIDTAGFGPLSVKVTNNGQPLANVQVTWTCAHPAALACQSEPSGASPIVTTTDGNGVSVLNKMGGKSVSAYYADGALTMTATYGKASAAFHLTVAPAPASAAATLNVLTLGNGNNQVVKRGGSDIPGGKANFGPLSVTLKNAAGKPIANTRVNFLCQTPNQGMACQLEPAGGASSALTTDANGVATLNHMGGNSITVYYASGKFGVQVAADGAKPVSFSLEAQDAPAPPAAITTAVMSAVSGGGQKAARLHTASGIDTAEFGPLSVKVTNNGQPLANVQVTWTCAHPAALACQSEPSGASPIVTTTDGNGVSVLNKMGGNSVSAYYADGAITMTATYGKASASFPLTVGPVAAPVVATPVVTKPVVSAPVAPAVLPGQVALIPAPAPAVLNPAVVNPSVSTLLSQESAQRQTANALAARVNGLPETLTTIVEKQVLLQQHQVMLLNYNQLLAALNAAESHFVPIPAPAKPVDPVVVKPVVPAPPVVVATVPTLTISAGNNQVVKRGGSDIPGGKANFGPLSVVFKDKAGKPVVGARVNFLCKTSNPGMACQLSPAGGGGVPTTTDANGVATLNQMGGNSITVYYASGKFTVEAAADGVAAVNFNLEAQDAPAPPAPITSAVMTLVSGDNQNAARMPTASAIDTAEFAPLSVKVTNNGQPVPNVQITWTCAHPGAMACQSEPSGASPIVTTTDGNGVSVLNKMGGKSVSAYYADGAITMTATYGKASTAFHLTVAPAPASAAATLSVLTVGAGNNQIVKRGGSDIPGGKANFGPLSVTLKNAAGKPVSGARVNFLCQTSNPAMACQLSPAGGGGVPVTTDANGVATLNQMGGNSITVYYASGKFTVQAAADGAKAASFSLEAQDAPAAPAAIATAVMTAVSGGGQKAARLHTASGIDTAEFAPLSVKVTNNGQPVANVQITWTCAHPAALACQSEPSGASPIVTTTDGNGVSVLNKMGGNSVSAYYADGALTMTATYGKASVSFPLTVGPVAPAPVVTKPVLPVVTPVVVKPVTPVVPTPIVLNAPSAPTMPSSLTAEQQRAWEMLVSDVRTLTASINAVNAQVSASRNNAVQMTAAVQQQEVLKTAENTLMAKFDTLIAESKAKPVAPIVASVVPPIAVKPVTPAPAPIVPAVVAKPVVPAPVVSAPVKSLADLYQAKLEKLTQKLDASKLDAKEKTPLSNDIKAFADSLKAAKAPTGAAIETAEDKYVKLGDKIEKAIKEGSKTLFSLYEKKLDKLTQKLGEAKLDAKDKTPLSDDIKSFADSLKAAKAPTDTAIEKAEDKYIRLGDKIEKAVKEGSKTLFSVYEKKLDKLTQKLDASKLDAAAKTKLTAEIEAFTTKLKSATVKLTSEAAEEAFSKLGDDFDAAVEKAKKP